MHFGQQLAILILPTGFFEHYFFNFVIINIYNGFWINNVKKILTVNLLLIFAAQTALSKDYKSMTIDDYFKRENVCISKIGDDSVGYYPSYEPNGWAGRIRNIGNKKVEYCD